MDFLKLFFQYNLEQNRGFFLILRIPFLINIFNFFEKMFEMILHFFDQFFKNIFQSSVSNDCGFCKNIFYSIHFFGQNRGFFKSVQYFL